MAGKPKYGRKALREAIKGSRGIKTEVARALGCSRQTVDTYLKRYPDLEAQLVSERETLVDLAESKLAVLIEHLDVRAIMFALETLGKKRGYTKRVEATGADGAPLGLSPDVLGLIEAMGLGVSDVVRAFEEMIRAEAALKQHNNGAYLE
jgi:hypothetical protein